jgi:hypothetical protein
MLSVGALRGDPQLGVAIARIGFAPRSRRERLVADIAFDRSLRRALDLALDPAARVESGARPLLRLQQLQQELDPEDRALFSPVGSTSGITLKEAVTRWIRPAVSTAEQEAMHGSFFLELVAAPAPVSPEIVCGART